MNQPLSWLKRIIVMAQPWSGECLLALFKLRNETKELGGKDLVFSNCHLWYLLIVIMVRYHFGAGRWNIDIVQTQVYEHYWFLADLEPIVSFVSNLSDSK